MRQTGGEESGETTLIQKLELSRSELQRRMSGKRPSIAVVLGSGLGPFADRIENAICIPFQDIPFMKTSTATSHVGRFVIGDVGEKCVICMQGRLHGYEGYSPQDVAYPIWLMHSIGADTLITTNAAGAINPNFDVGDFCIMSDHINFTGRNPIQGIEPDELSFRFFSMLDAYDPELRALAKECAIEHKIAIHEGVYLGLLGPSFETPAEIRTFRSWGADTVAMSVCEEVIAARHVSMKVLGISLCTNMACGIDSSDPCDQEVLDVASWRSEDFCNLLTSIIEKI